MDLHEAANAKYLFIIHSGLVGENKKFCPGSLWRKSPTTERSEYTAIELENADTPDIKERCHINQLLLFEELLPGKGEILIAMKNLLDRVTVYQTQEWLNEGLHMAKGEQVDIVSVNGIPNGTLGRIRYRGPLPGRNGIQFGVEIIDSQFRGKGTSDGTFKKQRYFECEEECGLFVNIQKIRRHRDESFSLSLTEDFGPTGHTSEPQHTVSLNERVVWISDNGIEFGTVLWTGILPDDQLKESMVGVQFDNPVGSGTGKYKGTQLFTAKKGHASLVPVIGLLKADEFMGASGMQPPDVIPHKDPMIMRGRSSEDVSDSNLTVGSPVLVLAKPPRYGVIRWIGHKPGSTDMAPNKLIAGVEMEVPDPKCYTDGEFCKVRVFQCEPFRAFFVYLHKCQPDDRERSPTLHASNQPTLPVRQASDEGATREIPIENHRGIRREPVELGDSCSSELTPYCPHRQAFTEDLVGRDRGIIGGSNSCYMDTVFMAMFTFSSEYDFLFLDPAHENQTAAYVKQNLQDLVVQPLRENFLVTFEDMMKFRGILDRMGPTGGFSTSMKDVEEFLDHFFSQILHTPEFLQFSTNQRSYLYQLLGMPNKDHIPSVQQLMEYSFVEPKVKLTRTPSRLILQMPRFGARKIYDSIFLNPVLDASDIIMGFPRQCNLCSMPATLECIGCLQSSPLKTLSDCSFCNECFEEEHPTRNSSHDARNVDTVPGAPRRPKREKFRLMAVVCIRTSHYVCYLRCGKTENATWIYADSMAHSTDNKVISEVWACPDVGQWLQSSGQRDFENYSPFVKVLAEDAYLCFYETI